MYVFVVVVLFFNHWNFINTMKKKNLHNILWNDAYYFLIMHSTMQITLEIKRFEQNINLLEKFSFELKFFFCCKIHASCIISPYLSLCFLALTAFLSVIHQVKKKITGISFALRGGGSTFPTKPTQWDWVL
jgi:hypothetical protein